MKNQGADRKAAGVENRRINEVARQRVLRKLAALHHDEYRRLLQRERKRLGYKPLAVGRPAAGGATGEGS